jgi:hypothetical protein
MASISAADSAPEWVFRAQVSAAHDTTQTARRPSWLTTYETASGRRPTDARDRVRRIRPETGAQKSSSRRVRKRLSGVEVASSRARR